MSQVTITADVAGWEEMIQQLFEKSKASQKLLAVAAQAFAFQDIIKHFEDESGPDGKWKARSETTQKRYQAIFEGRWKPPRGMQPGTFNPTNKILQLTGNLRKANLPTNIEEVGDHAIRIFNNAIYSAIHNYGDESRGMPQREFMWISDEANQKMAEAIMQMFLEDNP